MAKEQCGPGLRRALTVWTLWAAVATATFATNARVPISQLYAVDDGGLAGAAGRVVVLLGWPIALAAVAIVCLSADRLLDAQATGGRSVLAPAGVSLALCLTIVLPGVVDPKDVDLRAVNIPAAAGTALAVAISVWAVVATGAGPRLPRRAPPWVVVLGAACGLAALPWLLANLGLYVADVPGLEHVFMSKQIRPEPGYPYLRAVHLGNHDGLDGLLLALTAGLLIADARRLRRLRDTVIAYLSVLLVYGLGVAAADWSVEQVKKRGWTATGLPSVARPSLSLAWAVMLAAAAGVWLVARRRDASS